MPPVANPYLPRATDGATLAQILMQSFVVGASQRRANQAQELDYRREDRVDRYTAADDARADQRLELDRAQFDQLTDNKAYQRRTEQGTQAFLSEYGRSLFDQPPMMGPMEPGAVPPVPGASFLQSPRFAALAQQADPDVVQGVLGDMQRAGERDRANAYKVQTENEERRRKAAAYRAEARGWPEGSPTREMLDANADAFEAGLDSPFYSQSYIGRSAYGTDGGGTLGDIFGAGQGGGIEGGGDMQIRGTSGGGGVRITDVERAAKQAEEIGKFYAQQVDDETATVDEFGDLVFIDHETGQPITQDQAARAALHWSAMAQKMRARALTAMGVPSPDPVSTIPGASTTARPRSLSQLQQQSAIQQAIRKLRQQGIDGLDPANYELVLEEAAAIGQGIVNQSESKE